MIQPKTWVLYGSGVKALNVIDFANLSKRHTADGRAAHTVLLKDHSGTITVFRFK